MRCQVDRSFWQGKRVLLTGHTGFKGGWTAVLLKALGAEVFGLSLPPETEPNLYDLVTKNALSTSVFADVRDADAMGAARRWAPEIVLHMAAQPLVRKSHLEPVATFATNVMGVVNTLEVLRDSPGLQAILVITTDKVYRNEETGRAFREDDPLGGADPYSASKAAADLAAASYGASFFEPKGVPVATARAGNVIGGGDWSQDRIVPDIWRAARAGAPLILRMPQAVRPWQHVIEPVVGYLLYCQRLATAAEDLPRALNFGPPPSEVMRVGDVAEYGLAQLSPNVGWRMTEGPVLQEMKLLSLDPTAAVRALGWRTRLDARAALDWTMAWYRAFDEGRDMVGFTMDQCSTYLSMDD